MSLIINSNISSLNAQNNLSRSGNALAQATERLSSGLKINSAADNAAGFAISQQYTTQIGALGQASSNASDAINLAQTTGSALQQVTANLQAIRDLAAQAANGTYTPAERGTIDKEVQQRLAEVTRIANQTTFNGKKVLDGSLGTQSFQVGANVGQTISVSLNSDVRASGLGQIAEVDTGDISAAFTPTGASSTIANNDIANDYGTTNGTFTVDGTTVTLSKDYTAAANQDTLADDVQDQLGSGYKVSYDATNGLTIAETGNTGSSVPSSAAPAIAEGTGANKITGISATAAAGTDGADLSSEGFSIQVGSGSAQTIDLSGAKSLQDVSDAINAAGIDGVSAAVSGDGKGIDFFSTGALTISDTGGNIIGANAKDVNAGAAYTAGDAAAVDGSLQGGNVNTVDAANALISRIDVALSSTSDFAAQLGAVQNRFQSTIATVSAQTTNLKASQSTIQDADFAAETAALSKSQVLQQAGISVLSKANAQPQQVLKLLQ